jgi:comEA protein
MKRKLFFWIDRLQITRAERLTISVLMVLILTLSAAITFYDAQPPDHEALYAELEKVFHERSVVIEEERATILARYDPQSAPDLSDKEGQGKAAAADQQKFESAKNHISAPISGVDSLRININEASAEELQQLPGIGPAYSQRIIEWRNENGSFESVEQLLEIRGIGPARLEKIRPLIVL